jgi:fluoroquinolone resistance protein
MTSFYGETFESIDYTTSSCTGNEYEQCVFQQCDFAECDFKGVVFIDCQFKGCNLSLAKLNKTAFRDVSFAQCKMFGLHFDLCNPLGLAMNFEGCALNYASFFEIKLVKAVFKNCQLIEVDFSGCNMIGADFTQSDFTLAVFNNSNIEKADFRSASNYVIDPEMNKIKKAKFSADGLAGLLTKYDIKVM